MFEKNIQNTFIFITLFITTFFGIFGFKLFGIIDFMVLVPFFVLFFILIPNSSSVKVSNYLFFQYLIFFLLIGGFLAFNFTSNLDNPFFLLRSTRALVTGLSLFVIFYYIVSRGFAVNKKIFNIILSVFMICAFAVYLQAFFPNTQYFFAELWGFNKGIKHLRAFGLSAGYDTTGYLLCWFSGVTLFLWFRHKRLQLFLVFLFVSGSVVFTSRTSMLLLIGVCFLTVVFSLRYIKVTSLNTLILSSFGAALFYYIIFPIIYASVVVRDGSLKILGTNVNSRFATTNIRNTFEHHFTSPDSFFSVLFGTGLDPGLDPGYTIALHHGGVLSILIYLFFYFFLYYLVKHTVNKIPFTSGYPSHLLWLDVWKFSVLLMLIVIVIGNFKNMYFFTRGYHELFIVLVAVALGAAKRLGELIRYEHGNIIKSNNCY